MNEECRIVGANSNFNTVNIDEEKYPKGIIVPFVVNLPYQFYNSSQGSGIISLIFVSDIQYLLI